MPKSEILEPPKEDSVFNSDPGPKNKEQVSATKKINLYRFLKMKPQKKGLEALLVSKFKQEIMTMEQWEAAVKGLLATKTK